MTIQELMDKLKEFDPGEGIKIAIGKDWNDKYITRDIGITENEEGVFIIGERI